MNLGLTSSQGAHVAGHLLDSVLFGKSVTVRDSTWYWLMAILPGGGLVYFDHFLGNLGDIIGEEFEVSVIMDNAPPHVHEQR